jgi:hypothetical protein
MEKAYNYIKDLDLDMNKLEYCASWNFNMG